MAGYQRKSLQVLDPGFVYNVPPDKIPIGNQYLCQNFRSDSLGKLVSRPGYNLKIANASAGIAHSAMYAGTPGQYFVGCNAAPDGSGSTVYYGGIGGVQVQSGFDGNRIAFASMNGYTYVMNRGNQGRILIQPGNFASWEAWTLEGPTAAPALATGPPGATAASVDYTWSAQASGYNHFLTIGGTTYSFTDDGTQTAAQVASQIATLAASDPNCSVAYSGTGATTTIAPRVQNVTIPVTGSDGNPAINLNNTWGPAPDPVQGTYTFYLTWQSQDLTLESNPSSSASISVNGEDIEITISEVPTDTRVGFVNIYTIGGTLKSAYRIAQLAWNTSSAQTTFQWVVDEAAAVTAGFIMPITHDPPPAAAGMIGPHFSRLYAWSTAKHRNRLFWTDESLPQYWPGSTDEQQGNWVDVGRDDEDIVWCTIHNNLLVIYKQRSIWQMIGSDPGTAQLEQVYDGPGLVNQWALTAAGQIDYFVGPGGLKLFDMSMVHDISGGILPIFNTPMNNTSPYMPPGNIQPGGTVNTNASSAYAVALGHAFGRLFLSYVENGGGYNGAGYVLMVFDEGESPEGQTLLRRSGRWFYERTSQPNTTGFFGFVFDGTDMIGLTGAQGANGAGYSLADFHSFLTEDYNSTSIECVYSSHYEDAGFPDNDKMWLEVVIDYSYDAGVDADVYIGFNSGDIIAVKVGILPKGKRQSISFAPGNVPGGKDAGFLARSMAVMIDAQTQGAFVIHNVFFYYYVEARLALVASTIPTDLGAAKVKECKELELDIDASVGTCTSTVLSDLPGNSLTVRYTANIGQNGRSLWKYPFTTTQGYLWQIAVNGRNFRLYGARLLMRAIGVYVDAYEAAAGFVWDSMELDCGSPVLVKQAREIALEADFNGNLTVTLLTDLPGDGQASRFSTTLSSSGGRRYFLIPLPQGLNATVVQGRTFRIQLSGSSQYALYSLAIHTRVIGVYIEAYEAAAGAVWDSLPIDCGFPLLVKRAREIALEIDLNGSLTVQLITDLPGDAQAVNWSTSISSSGGRRFFMIPTPQGTNAPVEGRMFRLQLSGSSPFALYSAALDVQPVGVYVEAYEAQGGAVWDSTPIDFDDPATKTFDQLRFEMAADASGAQVALYTDLPGEAMAQRGTYSLSNAPAQRAWVTVPLAAGIEGRSIRLLLSASTGFRLYRAQARFFNLGRYLAAEALNGADPYRTLAFDFQSERIHMYKRIEVDIWGDSPLQITVITDQQGALATLWQATIAASTRRVVMLTLPPGIRGRLFRIALQNASSGGGAARIYNLRVWNRPLSEAQEGWAWRVYPLETSDVLPAWHDFPLQATPPEWAWSKIFSVEESSNVFTWQNVLSVDQTPGDWRWVDLDMAVTE